MSSDCVFLVLHYDIILILQLQLIRVTVEIKNGLAENMKEGILITCVLVLLLFTLVEVSSLYLPLSAGKLISYNITLEEWRDDRNLINGITPGYEAFELKGEVGVVYFYDDEDLMSNDSKKLGYIRKFDQTDKNWVGLDNLGDEGIICHVFGFSCRRGSKK